jgi:hypothetical protein
MRQYTLSEIWLNLSYIKITCAFKARIIKKFDKTLRQVDSFELAIYSLMIFLAIFERD